MEFDNIEDINLIGYNEETVDQFISMNEIDIDKSLLETYYKNGSFLSGHVSHKGLNGIELSTGALGHGLSIGIGMALNAKIDNKDYNTYVILGDGECNEGSIWEAVMFASHKKLDNLIAIIDKNNYQAMGECKDVINIKSMKNVWESFDWDVYEINGHDYNELESVFKKVSNDRNQKPKVVIANTIKGKGISFMENNNLYHYRDIKDDTYEIALKELEEK